MTNEVMPKRPLFRQEAVEFQRQDQQWGRVVPLQPLATRVMVWFITVAVLAVIAFLFVAQYARKETAMGYLTPAAGTARIFPPQPGTVSAVHVEQGQHVEAGQPLLSVTTSRIANDGEDVDTTILSSLARQKESLSKQIGAEERRTVSERDRLMAEIQGLENEIGQLGTQIVLQRDRIRLAESLIASAAQLAPQGLISDVERRRREEMLLEQKQGLNTFIQQLTSRQNQLTQTRYTLEQLPTVMAEKIQQLRNELAATEQRIAEVNGHRAYVIRAPIAGRVSSLQASVGQVADPQRLQMQIVPEDSVLQAELFIPTRAIGFVEVGQHVRILYDAFPYQHFGTYRGRIASVSQTILTSSDITAPLTLKEPAYKATVVLDRPDIDAYGKRIPLQPDMLLRADIILERRTLMDWILNPLRSARIQG